MVPGLAGQPNTAAPAKTAPVTAAAAVGGCLNDITETNLRQQYPIKGPRNGPAFLNLKLHTPTRLGLGQAGVRYKTISMLHIRANRAAAQDLVPSYADDAFVEKDGFIPVQTLCQNKGRYLTRPDRGRRFDEANQVTIRKTLGQNPKVVLAVGDGLSSAAIEVNAVDHIQTARTGLKTYGLESGPVLFIKYYRVGAPDHVGELTGVETVCLLVGERPGLVTAEPMSAHLTYKPRIGISESKHTVISNIHHQGTTAVKAGAYITELIEATLEKKASGIDLWWNTSACLHGVRGTRINVLPCGQNLDAGQI